MIVHIYKVLELLYPEEDILNQKPIKKQVKPELLASVVCGEPRKIATYNEEGEKTGEEEVFNIQDYYPKFNKDTMMATNKKLLNPYWSMGEVVSEKPKPPEPPKPVAPYIPTDEEQLQNIKDRLFYIAKEMAIAKELEIPCWVNLEDLQQEKIYLIQEHKELSELIAKDQHDSYIDLNL